MAFPSDVLGTTSFKIWRERFNTVKNSVPERIESASADPAATDDDYPLGSLWVRLDTNLAWVLVHTTITNDAVWTQLGAASTIVGITGTKAEFNTALTDGDFAFSGGAFHDGFSDFVTEEHIDWTNASDDLLTTGSLACEGSVKWNVTGAESSRIFSNTAQVSWYMGTSGTERAYKAIVSGANVTQHDWYISNVIQMTLNGTDVDFSDNDITTTGNITADFATITGDGGIRHDVNTNYLAISGGTSGTVGANIYLYGGAHGTVPYDMYFRSDGITELHFDYSANLWDFQSNDISVQKIEIGQDSGIYRDITTSSIRLAGGTNVAKGGNIILYGGSHGSQANDIQFLAAGVVETVFDYSESLWNFQANEIRTDNVLRLKERAASQTDVDAFGQLWVKTATPNLLYFTDDAGTDFQLGQESLWDEQNTSITAVLGGRYVKNSGASHTITLPVGTGHDVIPNYVMVWNNDTDTSTLTLDPNGTNSIVMQGASLGAGVSVVLQPGEAFMVSGRQAGPSWDGRYLTNRSFAANTVSVNNTSSESFPTDTKISGLTEEATPVAGDWLLGEESGGALRKFDVGNIGGGGGITWQLQATSATLEVGNGYYFAGAAAQVFTLPATFSQGDAPIYITNIDTADSVSVIPTTGDGLYLGNQSLAATSNAFDLNIGDSIMLIPRTSNATWLLVPLHVQGGLQPVVNLGTATTTEQIDIGECENYYVAIGADNVTLDINTVREHGQGYYAKKGQCWVHMNAAYTGLNVTTDNGTTNTINQGTPPSASGDDAILAWHYTRYNATEYLWVEWISML